MPESEWYEATGKPIKRDWLVRFGTNTSDFTEKMNELAAHTDRANKLLRDVTKRVQKAEEDQAIASIQETIQRQAERSTTP